MGCCTASKQCRAACAEHIHFNVLLDAEITGFFQIGHVDVDACAANRGSGILGRTKSYTVNEHLRADRDNLRVDGDRAAFLRLAAAVGDPVLRVGSVLPVDS